LYALLLFSTEDLSSDDVHDNMAANNHIIVKQTCLAILPGLLVLIAKKEAYVTPLLVVARQHHYYNWWLLMMRNLPAIL
jgi:hypothetical protein